jgi:aerobic carbon-monoxide dehydrogenase small subunit
VRWAISGNLCRCTGYVNIVAAIRAAGEQLRAPADVAGAGARSGA